MRETAHHYDIIIIVIIIIVTFIISFKAASVLSTAHSGKMKPTVLLSVGVKRGVAESVLYSSINQYLMFYLCNVFFMYPHRNLQ